MAIKLSIIIVNYNTQTVTKNLLTSLLKQDLPQTTEIIVVDNNSSDDSVPFLRADYPEITVLENIENVGLAAGVNIALQQAKGKYYLILNPDMIALLGSIDTLVSFLDKNPDVGMAGGKLISPNNKLQYSAFRFYKPSTIIYRRSFLGKTKKGRAEIARFLMKDVDHSTIQDVDWLMGACLMVRALAVKEVGGMDERYFLYFEDVDWCRRFWEKGWRVTYVPEAVFSHFYQHTSRGNALVGLLTSRPTREHIKSAFKYFWKFHGKPLPR